MREIQIENLKQSISDSYQKELSILRSLLGSLMEEREALLSNDTYTLDRITKEKDILLEGILQIRENASKALHSLKEIISSSRHQHLKFDAFMDEYPTEDFSNIHLLRQTLEAIAKKIQEETLRNEYLIKNKVSITRNMIHKLQGDQGPQTYGPGGQLKAKQKKTKVTLINREV